MSHRFITGHIETPVGNIPIVSTKLQWRDYLGAIKVRWGLNREGFRVEPGIYAIGTPNSNSDVLVTGNYKLSFDTVRKNCTGLNVWLLVLDTKGVNVWCAAGKGTFGTTELVNRINDTSLEMLVSHRRLILPQLGATGVSAHELKKLTGSKGSVNVLDAVSSFNPQKFEGLNANLKVTSGFSVKYGPVRAADIKAFIEADYKATPEMRKVQFNLIDRAKLIPNDFMYGLKYFTIIFLVLFAIKVFGGPDFSGQQLFATAMNTFISLFVGYISGIVLTPLLLPWLPIRMFALKGLVVSLFTTSMLLMLQSLGPNTFEIISWYFINAAIASFVAMNFTGSSTYTSLSGVKVEMRKAIPVQISFAAIGLGLFVFANVF